MAKKKASTAKSKKSPAKKTRKKPAETKIQPHNLRAPVPSSLNIVKQSWRTFMSNWRVLLGIVAVYLVLNILFAGGLSSLGSAVDDIRRNLDNQSGSSHSLAKAVSGFVTLVGSAGAAGSASASLLQSGLFVVESLVVIWALRHLVAGKAISVKEAYYHSTYPLIPFLLVLLVVILELLPITIGMVSVNAVLTTAISSLSLAAWLSLLFFLILAGWSFYLLSSTIFAIYIVTLPEVKPLEAMRSAKNLVKHRRWTVMPKIVFLPVFIFVVMGLVIMPLIAFATALVVPVFFVLSMLAILFAHTYLYSLYRGLLG